MKTKIFLSSALVLAVLFSATALGVGEVSAATKGVIKNLFPPSNNGTVRGVGMIDGHDGNKYVFRTPGDNGGKELEEGEEVFFEPGNGRTAYSVAQESSSPIGEAVSGLIDEIRENDTVEFELQEGKKGLNAVNVKTLYRDGGESTREWVQEYVVDREMVMPGDNMRVGGNAKALDAFVNRTTKALKKGDRIALVGFGSFSVAKRNGGDLESPGRNQGIGHVIIVKDADELPAIEIGLPRTKGTVKFFNEKKTTDSKTTPTKIIRIIKEIKL